MLFPETYTRTWTRKFRSFFGKTLADPERMLQGTGEFRRHVQLKPGKTARSAERSKRGHVIEVRLPEEVRGVRAKKMQKERQLGRSEKAGDEWPGEKCGNAKLEIRKTNKPSRKKRV